MYFSGVCKEYLPAMAELERKSYPKELVLGLGEFEREYKEAGFFNCSLAGFVKGELVCYVTAYEIRNENPEFLTIYISDVNCPNPAYLERLLIRFFTDAYSLYSDTDKVRFTADMRSTSYKLLSSSDKRDRRGIHLWEDTCIPDFYSNGEPTHRVAFSVNLKEYLKNSWKARFLRRLDRTELSDNDILSCCVDWLEDESKKGVDFYGKKNMNFVLKSVEEKLLDYFQMFEARIPMTVGYVLYRRAEAENGFEKTIAAYQSYGYKEGKGEKSYRYYNREKLLVIQQHKEAYNTDFPGTISGYRWLAKKETRFCEKIKTVHHDCCFYYYNKYGVRQEIVRVPYLNERMYLYYLNRMVCIYTQINKMAGLDKEEEECFRDMCKKIYYLLTSKNTSVCIGEIVDRWNKDTSNYFHDWSLIVNSVMEAKSILTEGARKSILVKPYNQALKISRQLKAVLKMCPVKKVGKGYFHPEEIRKKLSSLLRKNIDCTEYIKGMTRYVLEKNRKSLRIPVSEEQRVADYIARVQMYSPWITIFDLFQYFGRQTLFQFIKGTYPCVFKPQIIQPSYAGLSEFVLSFLKTRTVQAKHVYRSLIKKELLTKIQSGELAKKQYEEILEVLKFHNVAVRDEMLKKLCDFKIQIEPKGSPEFLTAGDASVCCMGCGSSKAIDYAKEKGFGILNAYYKDRVIANSVIWIHEIQKCLVLDNIEVHPNYMMYGEILKDCFMKAAEELMYRHGLDFAVQGAYYNDLVLFQEDAEKVEFTERRAFEVKRNNFYSDAMHSRIICKHIPEQMERMTGMLVSAA